MQQALASCNSNSPSGQVSLAVCRAQDNHTGMIASDQLLHRLMVSGHPRPCHAVVSEDINHRQGVHGREAHGRTHVVAEDEEVPPYGIRPQCKAIPFKMAPIAFSRKPKCILRPAPFSGSKFRLHQYSCGCLDQDLPSPPSSPADESREISITFPEATRVAIGPSAGANVGRPASQSFGSFSVSYSLELSGKLRVFSCAKGFES